MINETAPTLSERELEVLKLVATGASNQQIARDLVISPNTVKVHLRNIFEKLGVQSRTEATLEAVRRGWVCIEGAVIIEGVAVTAPPTEEAATPAPPEPEPLAPARTPIGLWPRIYMLLAAGLVALAVFLPGWWQSRGEARRTTVFGDLGQPQVAPAIRQLNRWAARAPLPAGRSRLALAAVAGKIFAIGGETAEGITGQVTIYNPANNGWLSGAAKPVPVANVTGAVLGSRVYVPGGSIATRTGVAPGTTPASTGEAAATVQTPEAPTGLTHNGVTDVVDVYDTESDTWSSAAPLPAPRTAYGLAVLSDKLYLFGGWDGTSYRAETYIYDPQADRWTTGTSMARPRGFLAASALKDVIFVVGGYDGRRELDTVAAYDPRGEGTSAGPWSARPALNQPRAALAMTTLASRLYVIGGGWNSGLAFNEQYDLVSGAWSRIESPVLEQWRNLGLAGQNEKIYAVGGWSGSYLTANEEYQAIYRIGLPASKAP